MRGFSLAVTISQCSCGVWTVSAVGGCVARHEIDQVKNLYAV